MALNIKQQIENIDKSIQWMKEYRPEHYDTRFLQLVEERRKLRILENAERSNPGIAAFGQSQVGKSYLMNCILQDGGTPFLVESPKGSHNFVHEINPIGDGAEATGVITRFTAYNRHPEDYSRELPIRMRTLSVRDILIIICESYFNQFTDFTLESESEIIDFCDSICDKYKSQPDCAQAVLTADDMLEMKLYFKQHVNKAQVFSGKTAFFERLALVINKIPVSEYINIFSILWHHEALFTRLFKTSISILQKLQFAEYVYLPITAVLHEGVKAGTIMSVSCLKLLYEEESKDYMTEVFGGVASDFVKLGTFTKSEICTICAEVVLKIEESFMKSTGRYDMRNVKDECTRLLTSGEITMSVLNNADLLDFPGARPSEMGLLKRLSELQEEKVNEALMYSFLRGKVEYLFNKYNEEQAINILLFCHHLENNNATQMQHLLEQWVNNYVGDTPEKRAALIRQMEVSPLFYIGTMWNKNLESHVNATTGNTPKAILNRWKSRFTEILLGQCFHAHEVDWVKNWNGVGSPFNNCYMLRDFIYSKNIYTGFSETGKEQSMSISEDYYELMREIFCQYNEETHLFSNPQLAWDASASIGNDGSLYIIEQLSKVAAKINPSRESQMQQRYATIVHNLCQIMKEYYVSDDTTELLSENIRKANGIFREIEFTCQNSPDYFGHLLQALQFTEAESFKEVHRLMPELGKAVHESDKIQDYELIRKRCYHFEGCTSESEKWDMFIKAYRFSNQAEADEYLKMKNISAGKLFKGETLKRKNSAIISDSLIKQWQENIRGVKFMNAYAGAGKIEEIVLSNLVDCVVTTAQSVRLVERIEEEISDYVDILNTSNINEDLIADMIATAISDFVMDFGHRYLSGEQIQTSRRVAQEMNLPCYIWTEKERKEHFEVDEMTELFNAILTSSERYTPAYEANYNTWLEYMYIAFIAHVNVPDYNREANEELKTILDGLKNG